ncbi:DUF402 domain-containing protein [Catellatospora citrea]|uniref:DUF402 domain-containing protein n=1 Tax=Catellatospora citrea TaxID=53366 RepID=UPI0033EDFBD9
MPPGAAQCVWWGWRSDGDFGGWYVNHGCPVTRWSGGVDVYDRELDLLVYPDGRWSWRRGRVCLKRRKPVDTRTDAAPQAIAATAKRTALPHRPGWRATEESASAIRAATSPTGFASLDTRIDTSATRTVPSSDSKSPSQCHERR